MVNKYTQIELDLDSNIISGEPRKLINGENVSSYLKPINLIIHTKAPEKWKLIDLETGEEYIGSAEPNDYGVWTRIKDKNKSEIGYSVGKWSDDDDFGPITPFFGKNI
jgi:hypothetical protein